MRDISLYNIVLSIYTYMCKRILQTNCSHQPKEIDKKETRKGKPGHGRQETGDSIRGDGGQLR